MQLDSTSLLILGAAALIAVGVVLFSGRKPAAVATGRRSGRAGRALIDQFEETRRDAAGAFVEVHLGQTAAASFFRELGAAASTQAPPPAPAPAPN